MSLLRRKPRGPVKRDPAKPRTRRADLRPPLPRPEPGRDRPRSWSLVFVVGFYLAFTKHIPFTGHGYELHATFENATTLKPQVAGADRGGQRRQGDLGRAPHGQHGRGHLHGRRPGPADPQGRDDHDPPAAVPRGQLLPRPPARQPERPELAERGNDPGHPDRHRGADRRDPDLAPGRPAASLQRALRGYGNALNHQPTAAEDATQDPDVQGLTGGEAINKTLPVRRQGRPRHRRSSTRRCSALIRTTSPA